MEDSLLIQHLQNKSLFDHPVTEFKVIETHISWVLLTGPFAYKIKKNVNLGFVDYSSLEKRKIYCEEELKLNQRLAADIYVSVLPIRGSVTHPILRNRTAAENNFIENNSIENSNIIEYAIKMHQFDNALLLSTLVNQNKITSEMMENLAITVAGFHLSVARADQESEFGSLESILNPFLDNFNACKMKMELLKGRLETSGVEILSVMETFSREVEEKCRQIFEELTPLFLSRKAKGFIRNCHGDLHLGNMVFIQPKVIVFDAIEFNLNFRWIDVMNEVAFLLMDLEARGYPTLADVFLNRYLQETGDYEGVSLLTFYKIYRAMVRIKISLENLSLDNANKGELLDLIKNYSHYIQSLIRTVEQHSQQTKLQTPCLILTYGVSGSGKTYTAKRIAPFLSAIHIRSDLERQRLFKDQITMNNSSFNLYSQNNIKQTYQYLRDIAYLLLKEGYTVIVDASFLKQEFRELFIKMAKDQNINFKILSFNPGTKLSLQRIKQRLEAQNDASEATEEILKLQCENLEPLTMEELSYTVEVDEMGAVPSFVTKLLCNK